MKKKLFSFLLGSNTPKGFVSHFEKAYDITDGWRVWIIKGGPGTGKSSMMKKIVERAVEQDEIVEQIFCSSDPVSLDAVILPKKKRLILDGTAPHIVEPKLVGACENIINIGQFWKAELLQDEALKILDLNETCSKFHKQATRYLNAADTFSKSTYQIAQSCTDKEKVILYAEKFADRELKSSKIGEKKEYIRLASAVTPKGIVFFSDSIIDMCPQVIGIDDEWGVSSDILLKVLREKALEAKYDIITCPCPINPNERIEHILIPELGLALCTQNKFHKIDFEPTRQIHASRFTDMDKLSKSKQKISFNRKAAERFYEEASNAMMDAKSTHDILEDIYIKNMNFKQLNKFADKVIDEFLK